MVVDTSALVAILRAEPEADAFMAAICRSADAVLPAAAYLELGIVIDRLRDPVLSRRLDELLSELGITVVEVTPRQARIARAAYRDFGKGNGHPAGLNFGDCLSYAVATAEDDELLFKGDDFGHTDVRVARVPGDRSSSGSDR